MNVTQDLALKDVCYEKEDQIAYITMNRPAVLNAFTYDTLLELRRCFRDFAADDRLRVAILMGEGRAFCAGVDLRQHETLAHAMVRPEGVLYGDLDYYLKPIITAVHGFAVGGGMTLALGADIRILAEDAQLGYPQVRTGILSVGGPLRLPRFIPGLARWYLLSGELIDAAEAYRLGLCVKVVPRERLRAEATALAQKICTCAPLAVRYTKDETIRAEGLPMYEGYRIARQIANDFFESEDYVESVRAFREKRKPVWHGR